MTNSHKKRLAQENLQDSFSFKTLLSKNSGLTLVELMIAVAISGFVIAAIYMSYKAQQRASFIQDEVASMQQNARAALSIIEDDIRMAGYDPTGNADAGIHNDSNATLLRFTMDSFVEDGNASQLNEDIVYDLYTAGDGTQTLGRTPNGSNPTSNRQAVAENIEYLDFLWLDDNGTPTATLTEVRSIEISLLARSRTADPDYTNDIIYQTARGDNPKTGDANATATYADGVRRRMFTGVASCRNLGL